MAVSVVQELNMEIVTAVGSRLIYFACGFTLAAMPAAAKNHND